MYAHEIVADLKRLSTVRFGGLNKQGEIELRFLQSFLKLAQESQYFHFGHRTVLAKMFGGFKTINVQEHYVKYKDFIILPYPKMCIEYVQSTVGLESCHDGMLPGNKAAIFVEDIGCQILVRMCTYFPTFRSWSPSVETIAISKDTNEVRSGWLIGHIRPQATDGILDAFTNAICCLTLLNCKNVHAEKVVPPQALQKKRERNGKLPMIGYHTVYIDVTNVKQRVNLTTMDPKNHNGIHTCRGHFKIFTKERPLFGKYVGMFWWKPRVRGKNKDRIIMKDYKVRVANKN